MSIVVGIVDISIISIIMDKSSDDAIEKRRAEQSMRGMLLLKAHYGGTKVMPIYRDELSREGRRNLRPGGSPAHLRR